jgi:hypothetical protein
VHFGNNAEEPEWVDAALSKYPNMLADLAARIPEIGRHDPATIRKLFLKHQDRILFATDFQVYDRLILGSSGNEPPPTDADAEVFYAKEWRWLETRDRNWEHMTPIQGNWTISSIGLPGPVLRKVYFDNARKLLARSLPTPAIEARHISQDFDLNGCLLSPLWQTARPVRLEQASYDGTVRQELSTTVRALWSDQFLYLAFEAPFTRLTVFEPPNLAGKRVNLQTDGASLWDRDVVEAFIGTDRQNPRHYAEFEVAPTNERLDLMVKDLPEKDFGWNSQWTTVTRVDAKAKSWTCEMRVPLKALSADTPAAGIQWQANFYRCDRAQRGFLAWNPTLQGTFHVPERFGTLRFIE